MGNVLLTMKDLCELCQVTRFTVRRWCRAGLLPRPIRMNRTLRWKPDEVQAALQTAGRQPASLDQ